MQTDKELLRKYKIVAGNYSARDFLDLLEYMAMKVADVRTPLSIKQDSMEIRLAVNSYLQEAIDSIRRIKDNKGQLRDGESSEDSI